MVSKLVRLTLAPVDKLREELKKRRLYTIGNKLELIRTEQYDQVQLLDYTQFSMVDLTDE